MRNYISVNAKYYKKVEIDRISSHNFRQSRIDYLLDKKYVRFENQHIIYHENMQEDKEGIFDSIDNIKICIEIFYEMLSTMEVNESGILESMKKGFLNATDVADYLAKNGMPFRQAHKVVGEIVSYCEQNDISIDDMKLEDFLKFSNVFKEDVLDAITIENCVNNRNSYGGTSIKNVTMQLELAHGFLNKL